MANDDIKREFIYFMEEKHSKLLFPKKYFGCMMAVFIEQEPITQDRIEELTGYSKTTISQMLKIIQMEFPLKPFKKPNIRKKYYTIDVPTREFMLTLLTTIIESYNDKIDFFPSLIAEIKPHVKKHPKFRILLRFLEDFYHFSTLYMKLLTDTKHELIELVNTGQINASELSNYNILSSPEHQNKIQTLMNTPSEPESLDSQIIKDPVLAQLYAQLKDKFFRKFQENLTYSGSQQSIARAIIGTEILLEQRPLTQQEIERATKFQRSIISDTLNLLIKMKMIEVVKTPGESKNYYKMIQSWDKRTISRFRINVIYANEMKEKFSTWIEKVGLEGLDKENSSLIHFLKDIHHTYSQFEIYFRLLEVKYLNVRLKAGYPIFLRR